MSLSSLRAFVAGAVAVSSPTLGGTPPVIITQDTALPLTVAPSGGHKGVSAGPGGFVGIWGDERNGDGGIYGIGVDFAGVAVGAEFPISLTAGERADPTVAFDGTDFLVAWDDFRSGTSQDIYAARVAPGGAVLDPSGVLVATQDAGQKFVPTIACATASSCLVVWSDRQPVTSWDIHGALLTQPLVVNVTDIPVWPAVYGQFLPALQAGGGQYLAAWTEAFAGSANSFGIQASRVSALGAALDADAGITLELENGTSPTLTAALTFDGANFWAAWEDDVDGGPFPVVRLALVDGDAGAVALGVAPGLPGTTTTRRPSLAYDGLYVWLAYEVDFADAGTIGGLRYSLDGVAAETPFQLGTTAQPVAGAPTLGSDGAGRTLLLYVAPSSLTAPTGVVHFLLLDESAALPDGGRDAGLADAGDAGSPPDGGPLDAGGDGGTGGPSDGGASGVYRVACDCSGASGGAVALAASLLLALSSRAGRSPDRSRSPGWGESQSRSARRWPSRAACRRTRDR